MQPNYQITERMLNLVQKISELTTQLSFEKRELHLRKENRVRSIQSSLAIENNSLSLEQVTDIIEGKRVLGPPKDIHEVQNSYEAYERAFQLNPYSVDDLLVAHRLLTSDLVRQPGQFRTSDVGVYNSQGDVVHVGARPQFVPSLVQELFDWAEKSEVSDIVKSCIVHYELEIIHPFEDGNGRMGRLWQSLILSCWNSIFEWLPIESVIYAHQQGYYDALETSNDADDSTVFIEFMLGAIFETLEEHQKKAKTPAKPHEHLTPKEEEIYQKLAVYLEEHTSVGSRQVQELTGLSASTSRRYLSLFVEKGLLTTTGSTKSTLYQLAQ